MHENISSVFTMLLMITMLVCIMHLNIQVYKLIGVTFSYTHVDVFFERDIQMWHVQSATLRRVKYYHYWFKRFAFHDQIGFQYSVTRIEFVSCISTRSITTRSHLADDGQKWVQYFEI